MKRIVYLIIIISALAVLTGCAQKPKKEVIATIGNYPIYEEDLVSEADLYPPAYLKTLTKEQILEELIRKKILLIEAQRQGLDRQPEFMKMIERFWEQSLLRSLLDKKSKELLSSLKGTEKERKERASQIIEDWVEELRKNTTISIDKEKLDKLDIR